MFLNDRLSLLAFRTGSDTRPYLDLAWMHLCEVRMLLKTLEIPIFIVGTLSIRSAYWMAPCDLFCCYYSAVYFLCAIIFLVALQKVIKGFSKFVKSICSTGDSNSVDLSSPTVLGIFSLSAVTATVSAGSILLLYAKTIRPK